MKLTQKFIDDFDFSFKNINLKYANLENLYFYKTIIGTIIKIIPTDFSNSNFKFCSFKNCDFQGCDLTNINFENCDLRNCIFFLTKLKNTKFKNCIINKNTKGISNNLIKKFKIKVI